jgi:hypothetical protein
MRHYFTRINRSYPNCRVCKSLQHTYSITGNFWGAEIFGLHSYELYFLRPERSRASTSASTRSTCHSKAVSYKKILPCRQSYRFRLSYRFRQSYRFRLSYRFRQSYRFRSGWIRNLIFFLEGGGRGWAF